MFDRQHDSEEEERILRTKLDACKQQLAASQAASNQLKSIKVCV